MKRPQGFTLVELLVFMALFSIVTGAAVNYFISSTRASALVAQRESVRGEMTLTNQLLISRLREACQVYPQGTSLTLAGTAGTKRGTSQTWTVSTDPMAAVITPSDAGPMLYAFYLLDRAEYIKQITDDTQKIPALNTPGTSYVLMQYAVPVAADACTNRPTAVPTTGATAQLIAQYVRAPASTEPAFQIGTDRAVVYQLRFEAQSGGKSVVYPGLSTTPMTSAVIGRNIQ